MVIIAAAAAAAAASAAAGKNVFGYNRDNFMEDREQRLKMEFALRRFRVEQAKLWREDVRGFISLTEKKMSIYLLVNVLMLGFTLNLWCEGRLPERTPEWLVMGNQIAIAGAFSFLLLTVWLAVHASVAAQSYQTRILTQLVRLPVPTWDELEACRTHASDFERIECKQMFRVPFLQGAQESLVRGAGGTPAAAPSYSFASSASSMSSSALEGRQRSYGSESQTRETDDEPSVDYLAAAEGGLGPRGEADDVASCGGASSACAAAATGAAAADPWGLERAGDNSVYELGCQVGEEVAKLRHIKLIRQAAVYWQTYDAFARVSMSLGVSQLMLAMSYYMLGYVLTQVRAPVPAFAGVAVLMGTAEVVARIDLTLPASEQRLVQVLMLFGPSLSCVATYLWAQHEDLPARIAESLAPVAFVSHGAVVGLLTTVLRVREQENGAMLPLAYQGVLYLDVFGWVSHKRATPDDLSSDSGRGFGDASPLSGASWRRTSAAWEAARSITTPFQAATPAVQQEKVPPKNAKKRSWAWHWWRRKSADKADVAEPATAAPRADEVNHYVIGYMSSSETSEAPEKPEDDWQQGNALGGAGPPASLCIAHDDVGRALPTRPEDVKLIDAADDYRRIEGAPRMWDTVNAIEPPAKEFWDPVTFMPSESRERQQMDDFLAEVPNFNGGTGGKLGGLAGLAKPRDQEVIETGHDNEVPGVVPWVIVRIAAAITSTIWVLAGCYCANQVAHIWTMHLPWWWEIPALEANESDAAHWHGPPPDLPYTAKQSQMAILQDSLRLHGTHDSGAWSQAAGVQSLLAESVVVRWPYPTIRPRSMACDVNGSRFLVSDGLSVFAARLATPSLDGPKRRFLSSLQNRAALATSGAGPTARPKAEFRRAPGCRAVMGDALQDVALLCRPVGAAGGGTATAEASAAANASLPGAGCEALVLHARGRRLASCPLGGAGVGRSLSLARGWLLSAAGAGEASEEAASVLADPNCQGRGVGALGSGCAWVGTTRGRVARLRMSSDGARLVPRDVTAGGEGPPPAAVGSVRPLAGGRLAALGRGSRVLRLLAAEGAAAGGAAVRLEFPGAEPPSAFCVGGDHIYALGAGPAPELWRFPLPPEGGAAAAASPSRTAASSF